mgnify:CR=1 FL=1
MCYCAAAACSDHVRLWCGVLVHCLLLLYFFSGLENGFASPTASSTSARLQHRYRLRLRLRRSAVCNIGLITRSNVRLQRLLQPIVIEHASTPLSFGLPLHRPLGCSAASRGPSLVVGTLRGTLLSVASPLVDFSPLHRHGAAAMSSLRTTVSPLSWSSSSFAHRQPRHPHWLIVSR